MWKSRIRTVAKNVARMLATGVLLVAAASSSAASRPTLAAGPPTPAEKYLLDQIAAGKVAKLDSTNATEATRVIRGVFLEELLTGSRKDCVIHRNGVAIEGAVVTEAVDLRNTKVPFDVRLEKCRFTGEVNFSKCVFEEGLSVESSTFIGPVHAVALKTGRGVSLQNAIFQAAANFSEMEVSGVLLAGSASFRDVRPGADFSNLKVGGNVLFTNATFAGPALFMYAHVGDNMKFDNARFTNDNAFANFEGFKVETSASFAGVAFAGYVSFKDARLHSLDLSGVTWPRREYGEWLWLNGLTYQRIAAGTEKDSWINLLSLVGRTAHRTAYSADIYSSLISFYRREGYPRQANHFFIAQKRREREEVLGGFSHVWSLFLDWFVGYGRSPERALFWSASIILLGTAVFRREVMEPRTTNLKADKYSAFWYSMDLFLPLIKLQDAELWKPRDDAKFARWWSRLHTMLGWALIPIAVAAWTGMLEK